MMINVCMARFIGTNILFINLLDVINCAQKCYFKNVRRPVPTIIDHDPRFGRES